MVPRKSWVSENFSPISESRQRFYRVSEARFFLVWFKNRLSLRLGFSNRGLGKSRILPFATPNKRYKILYLSCVKIDFTEKSSKTTQQVQ